MSNFNAVLARDIKGVAKSICGFSHTVAFSHYNNLSAQLPVDASGKIVAKTVKDQAVQCLKNIETIVKKINHSMNDVVKLTVFTKSAKDIDAVANVIATTFKKNKPAFTGIAVKDLPMNALVQIEAVITCGEGTIPNAPQAGDLIKVSRDTEIAPITKYSSQTVAFSHYNHISAQLPINPKTKKMVTGGVKEQLIQCLNNIKAILVSIDVPFDDIVKVNIYTTSLKDEKTIREVYKTFFPDSAIARAVNYLPALSINEVSGLQNSAKIAVDATVSHGDGTPHQLVEDRHGIVIKFNSTSKVEMDANSSQTVMFSHYNNISEIFPVDHKGKLASENVDQQLVKCLDNLKTIVKSVGHKLDDVVKVNIFVENIKSIDGFEKVMSKYFSTMPAGRIIAVSKVGKKASVKIDAIVSNAEGTSPEWKR